MGLSEHKRIRMKGAFLRARYHTRQLLRRTSKAIPMLLFAVSLLLSTLAIVPNMANQLREFALSNTRPVRLTVEGTVRQALLNGEGSLEMKPVQGAVIECGGFRTTTNASGEYHLFLEAQHLSSVPLIIVHNDKLTTERVSFVNGLTLRKDIILP